MLERSFFIIALIFSSISTGHVPKLTPQILENISSGSYSSYRIKVTRRIMRYLSHR